MEEKNAHIFRRTCWENGIKIYPIPMTSSGRTLKIEINNNGIIKQGEQSYNSETIYPKINELYKEIYTKIQAKKENDTAKL